MAETPSVDDVLAYMRTPDVDEDEREQIANALAAALEDQAAQCTTDPYSDALHWAALRRCARSLAARSSPLGVISELGEFGGAATLRQLDAEIEQYERPYRLSFSVVS